MVSTEELIKLAEQPEKPQSQLSTTELIKMASQPQPKMTWGQVGMQAVRNVPSDAITQLQNIVHLVKQPGKTIPESIGATASGIGKLGIGLIESLIPGEQGHEQVAFSVWNQLKQDYGGIENLKQTIANKPVQIMLDASSLLLGGGGAARMAGAKTGISAISKVGKVISKAGEIIEPTNIITAPIRAGAKAFIPKWMPERLYMSTLKPIGETPDELRKISNFGLNKELTVRYNSWLKVQGQINNLKSQVNEIIEKGTVRGDLIDINDIVKYYDDLKDSYAPFTDRPDLVSRQIDYAKNALIDYHTKRSEGKLTPSDIQKIKVTQHKLLENVYGELNASTKKALQKSLAYGTRENLEKLYPELKNLNLSMGEMLEFNKHLGKALMTHEKADLVRNIAFMIKAVVDQPLLKSKLAIWLNKAKKNNPLGNPKALQKDLLLQLGRITEQARPIEEYQNLQGESTLR
mgnify:CR=1 FL=1